MAKITFLLACIAVTRLVISKRVSLPDGTIVLDYDDDLLNYKPIEDSSDESVKTPKICETEDCKKIAELYISNMNKSADPCVDFYEYSCGRAQTSTFGTLGDITRHRLRDIFENAFKNDDDLPTRQAAKWYHACMDTEKLNAIGMDPINSILMQVGGWPIAMEENEWSADDYPWQMIENHYARLMGGNVFYDVKVERRAQQAPFGSIVLTPPERRPFKNRPFFNNDKLYPRFVTKIVKMFVKDNKAAISETTLQERIQELIQFEKNILWLATKEWDDGKPFPAHPMAFDSFVEYYRNRTKEENPTSKTAIDWETGITQIFRSLKIDIDGSEPVYVWNDKYFMRIGDFLERTPARTIVNYVHWNFIVTMLKHTTEEMRDTLFSNRWPRWWECLQFTKIRYISAHAYEKKYFLPTTRNLSRAMIENIKNGLETNVANSDWLDETSKSLIKRKIKNMRVLIGYPYWYTNQTALTNYYKSLTIGTQYFENALSYMRFTSKEKLLTFIVDGEDIWLDLTAPGGSFSVYIAGFQIPPVVFQMPAFSPDVPDYVNYGKVGEIGGHEAGHGVDSKHFLESGEIPKNAYDPIKMGLPQKIVEAWYKKVRCFVNQYDKWFGEANTSKDDGVTLKYDDMGHSKGSITIQENMASVAGLEALYTAYKQLEIKRGSSEPKLPGLEEFTNEQLFLISYANMYCEKKGPNFGKLSKGDIHSPANIGINVPLLTLNDFARIFKCPIGTPMNPIDKCTLWKNTSSESEARRVRWIKD